MILALLLAACATREVKPAAKPPDKVTLFFSAEVRGYIGPCGCSENMRGSISRSAHVIDEARREGVVHFIDCGDGLFGESVIPEAAVPQQERKAEALASSWKAMGLDVRATGPLDDARGAVFHQQLQLPEISADSFKIFDRVGVISANDVAHAEALVPRVRAAGATFVAAIIPLPFPELLGRRPESIDLLISARSKDAFAAEESRFVNGVAQIQSKGRSLLRIDVQFHGDGRVEWLGGDAAKERELASMDERIELLRGQVNEPMLNEQLKALRKAKLEEIMQRRETLASTPVVTPDDRSTVTARFIPLETTVPKDEKVAAFEKQYDVDVGLLNLKWAKEHGTACPAATVEKPGIVGTSTCITCHHEEGEVWRGTRHPLAYLSLKQQGKENHLDCVGCHVTGWQQPQGVCRIDQTEGRTEIGCESCHGPGSAHVQAPSKKNIHRAVTKDTCVQCHDRENSPSFDFDTYLPKILGPGHG